MIKQIETSKGILSSYEYDRNCGYDGLPTPDKILFNENLMVSIGKTKQVEPLGNQYSTLKIVTIMIEIGILANVCTWNNYDHLKLNRAKSIMVIDKVIRVYKTLLDCIVYSGFAMNEVYIDFSVYCKFCAELDKLLIDNAVTNAINQWRVITANRVTKTYKAPTGAVKLVREYMTAARNKRNIPTQKECLEYINKKLGLEIKITRSSKFFNESIKPEYKKWEDEYKNR